MGKRIGSKGFFEGRIFEKKNPHENRFPHLKSRVVGKSDFPELQGNLLGWLVG